MVHIPQHTNLCVAKFLTFYFIQTHSGMEIIFSVAFILAAPAIALVAALHAGADLAEGLK